MIKTLELPLGGVAKINGRWVVCVEDFSCSRCVFKHETCHDVRCLSYQRKDGKGVHFEIDEE